MPELKLFLLFWQCSSDFEKHNKCDLMAQNQSHVAIFPY